MNTCWGGGGGGGRGGCRGFVMRTHFLKCDRGIMTEVHEVFYVRGIFSAYVFLALLSPFGISNNKDIKTQLSLALSEALFIS